VKYRSHIGQDRWVSEVLRKKRGGYFLELGALDGVTASNTYWLEHQLGWNGLCVEPNPAYFKILCSKRSCIAVNRALWTESNIVMQLHDAHGLSRLTHLPDEPSTAALREKITKGTVAVDTITLLDLLQRFDSPVLIDYMSMDIEGSELAVIGSMDFSKYRFGLLSVEVNSDEQLRHELRLLLANYGYESCTLRNDELFYSLSNLDELTAGNYEHPAHVCDRVLNSYVVYDFKDKPPLTKGAIMPRPWLREFRGHAEWVEASEQMMDFSQVSSGLDDRLINQRKPFRVMGYCAFCLEATSMEVSWYYSGSAFGEVWPAWTETFVCSNCGLNSRMRAVYDYVVNELSVSQDSRVYMPEQVTLGFRRWGDRFINLAGSEYMGANIESGTLVRRDGYPDMIRHEDLMSLSFSNESFDLVVSQDIFEHVPEYDKAFIECFRVLSTGGSLIFSIPFFPMMEKTIIRAEVLSGGEVRHIHAPEFHGNPVSGDGALCYQNFGWDILDQLRSSGFSDVKANFYWGPWCGYYGSPFFVFSARKL